VRTAEARSQPVAVSNERAALDYCYERGWTDGLPVIPPTVDRVDAMLDAAGSDPEEILAVHETTGRRCSAHSAAVNAVMAGCLPEYFPVLIAALRALNREDFNYHASTASTGGSATMLIVSGPIVDAIGMNTGVNVFGSGNRANATIGRTLRLIHLNVFKMTPGITDRSTQGNPGKYSLCIGESTAHNPWEPLHVDFGLSADASAVTVYAAGGFHNVENHYSSDGEGILLAIADSMSSLGSLTAGQSVVVLSPEHAAIVAEEGWSRGAVRRFLYEHARRPAEDLRRVGRPVPEGTRYVHRGHGPDDILVTVAGGEAGGHSAFLPSWSRARASLFQTEKIT
jgi:hypothetical protein